jgi:predicted ArsR family transcriptional regulator
MKSTREKVLQTIKIYPKSTVVEIAEKVGINAISVRHHLTNLQADGLLAAEEERHGVGRPRLVFILTNKGEEKFPTRYFHLTNSIIEQLKEMLSEKEVKNIFMGMADKLTAKYKTIISSMGIEERLDLLKNIMGQEGFDLKWEKKNNKYIIYEIHCPFYQVGKHHPEICVFDKTLIANILSIPAKRIKHSKMENDLCKYTISPLYKNDRTKSFTHLGSR